MTSENLWMRAASFVALRDLVGLIAESPQGLRAKDIESLVQQQQRIKTRKGYAPSRTTLYHYRRILLRLNIVSLHQQRYGLNRGDAAVSALLTALSPGLPSLTSDERRLFARLVVMNEDCRSCFLDFFMPDKGTYDLEEFIACGQRVAWKAGYAPEERQVRLYNLTNDRVERWLRTEDEFQAILYGIRYWARNELGFLDELFLEDLGGVMFPVEAEGPIPDPVIIQALLRTIRDDHLWTSLSVRDVAYSWGPQYRVPLRRIFGTILHVHNEYSQYLVLIPTAEAFATITAGSPGAEAYQLRSYLQDAEGRYISHLRIHRRLKEVFQWNSLSHT